MISADISDVHKIVVTVMKTTFTKILPREINYRSYKKDDLIYTLSNFEVLFNFSLFQAIFFTVLNRHAPLKQKFKRVSEVPYMTKTLRKVIITRPRLHTRYYKTKFDQRSNRFQKANELLPSLLQEGKKKFLFKSRCKKTENKTFLRGMKPFMSYKNT